VNLGHPVALLQFSFCPGKDAKYCDEYVCLSVHSRILKATQPNFNQLSAHVDYGHDSVLLCWHCDT